MQPRRWHRPGSQEPGIALRLRAWWLARRLDRDLARGHPGAGSAEHELRVLQLASARSRWKLAHSLRELVDDATCARRPRTRAIPLPRHAIVEASEELLELANALTDPARTGVRGVALASWMLSDPLSPLYDDLGSDHAGALAELVGTAVELMGDATADELEER